MKKMITFMLSTVLLLSACTTNATVTLKEAVTIEYGSELQVEDLTEQEGLTLKEVKDYDAKKVGNQTVKVIFTNADGKDIEQEITLEVKDTKNPEITFKEEIVEITAGDEFDPKENIMSVTDIIDGDIAFSEDKETVKDGYLISGEYDAEAVGEYTITITAYDKNENKSEKSYKLNVKEAEEQEAALGNESFSNSGSTAGTANTGKTNAGQSSSGGNSTNSNAGSSSSSNSSGGTAVAPTPAPVPTPAPAPQPEQPAVLCPNGFYPNRPCDFLITGDGVPGNSGVWTSSEQEAIEASHWIGDSKSEWYRKFSNSFVGKSEWNDGRTMYTVVFY